MVAGACRLVLRYVSAEASGELWPDWRRAAEFLITPDSVASNYAIVSVDPRFCGSTVEGDAVVVRVQFGELGEAEEDLGDGHWFLVPKVQWHAVAYHVLVANGVLRLRYAPFFDPRIGIEAAVSRYRGGHLSDFRRELEEAMRGLRHQRRPDCPT